MRRQVVWETRNWMLGRRRREDFQRHDDHQHVEEEEEEGKHGAMMKEKAKKKNERTKCEGFGVSISRRKEEKRFGKVMVLSAGWLQNLSLFLGREMETKERRRSNLCSSKILPCNSTVEREESPQLHSIS